LFTDAFQKCTAAEIEHILETLTTIQPRHGFRAQGLEVLKKTLSFYPEAIYYDITQADLHPERTCQLVVGKKSAHILDGQFAHLHTFNLSYPLTLDRQNVVDYARFYLAHMMGPHGITRVIDTVDDLSLRDEPTPALRSNLNDKIVPLGLNAALTGGGYQVRGTILIKSTLYTALFDIDMTGTLSATMGRVLAEVLTLHDQVLEG
jgi:hypothetical protein